MALDKLWMDGNTRHRADLHALWFTKMTDALGAFVRVDFVDLGAHVDRIVRALGLAHVAVDTFIGYQKRHLKAQSLDEGLAMRRQ